MSTYQAQDINSAKNGGTKYRSFRRNTCNFQCF